MFRELPEAVGPVLQHHGRCWTLAWLNFAFLAFMPITLPSSSITGSTIEVSQSGTSGRNAYGVILELSEQAETTPDLASQRAVSAWAQVHGFATLTADGALSTAVEQGTKFEHLRPLLQHFLSNTSR
jgi:hypothetical protein